MTWLINVADDRLLPAVTANPDHVLLPLFHLVGPKESAPVYHYRLQSYQFRHLLECSKMLEPNCKRLN